MRSWEQRESARTGKPVPQVLALWLDYRAECVADGGKETMAMVRHQSPDWAEEIKIRALMLMEKRRGNNANRD